MQFSKVDDLIRPDHPELNEDDVCLFLREYRAGDGFKGETNSLILNLKKKPSERRTKGGYHYKAGAISQIAQELRNALNPKWLDHATLVPVPGSKAADHPDYDDRMEQICRKIRDGADVRNLVIQNNSTDYSHTAAAGERIGVEELTNNYLINEDAVLPEPKLIGIVDDVLTVGRHFRAMSNVLTQRFPKAKITGIFVARTIRPSPFEEIDLTNILNRSI